MNVKEIALVNSCQFQYELNLCNKFKVICYNQDGYNHLLYRLAKSDTVIHYSENLAWLESYNSEDNVRQVAIALYVSRIMKYVKASNDYMRTMLEAYKSKAEESIIETEETAKKLIKVLDSIEYVNANLNKAISENKNVFFSFGKYKNNNRALRTIVDNSDYDNTVIVENNEYYELVETLPEGSLFYIFSNSPYLSNLHKLALMRKTGVNREECGKFLYCNKKRTRNVSDTMFSKTISDVNIIVPPDDLVLDDPNKLGIYEIPNSEMFILQKTYVKKVDNIKHCSFSYTIMYDKYCLGAVGFDFSKSATSDLWQVSDFCTNNNIQRLSKLILFCILSTDMQRLLSRKLKYMIESVITFAYTSSPVSMKYRGPYKKDETQSAKGRLAYVGLLGKYGSLDKCLEEYKKSLRNAGKGK